ncbi:MAG TPA: phosphatidate cytidylyltransferase [Desertimonas sp.]|nr:phosphatidate cytidylyltransferase [Desertimonas sp.]
MSDDQWTKGQGERRDPRDVDDSAEFGGPLFPDEPVEENGRPATGRPDDTGQPRLRFGPDDTGPLPHWTAPPTGEIPSLGTPAGGAAAGDDDSDDVDVWSTFTTESPVWRDDDPVTTVMDQVAREPDASGASDRSGGTARRADPSGGYDRPVDSSGSGEFDLPESDYGRYGSGYGPSTGEVARSRGTQPGDLSGEVPLAPRREPGRITIGTDPSLMPRRPTDPTRRRPGQQRSGRPVGPTRTSAVPPRNMGNAIIAGLVIAAVFIIALLTRPVIVLAIIVVILALAAWEYFGKITEKGYRPAVAPGLAACVCAPLAAYWVGDGALPLVVAFAFMAGAVGFIGARGVESGPLPNMAVTTMGVVWIGLLGGYAALILRFSTAFVSNDIGTDTLFMLALGVAANDVGALVVGSAVGRTPLRPWVSPSKTLEGLLGGALVTIIALFIASKINTEGTWTDASDVLLLGLVIAVMAPLGDLTESMFKRNLDIKDFGTIVQGHGGVLDRFDGYLFALPAVYYFTLVTLF